MDKKSKLASRSQHDDVAGDVKICVLCPIRREKSHGLFSATKQRLVDNGFAAASIVRVEGIDRENQLGIKAHEVISQVFR